MTLNGKYELFMLISVKLTRYRSKKTHQRRDKNPQEMVNTYTTLILSKVTNNRHYRTVVTGADLITLYIFTAGKHELLQSLWVFYTFFVTFKYKVNDRINK